MKKYSMKKVLIYFGIMISLSALVYFSIFRNYSEDLKLITEINWEYTLPIVVLIAAIIFGGSTIIYVLTRVFKKDYKFKQAVRLNLIGLFFNAVTPLASGGQVVQLFVLKKQGVNKRHGLSILLLKFIIMQTTLVLISSVLFISRANFYLTNLDVDFLVSLGIVGFTANALVLIGLYLAAYSKIAHKVFKKIIMLGHRIIKMEKQKSKNKISGFDEASEGFRVGIKTLSTHKVAMSLAATFAIVVILSNSIISYFAAKTIGAPITMENLYDVTVLTMFVRAMNSFNPIPGASLGMELGYSLIFTSYFQYVGNVMQSSADAFATAMMFIWRIATFTIPVLVGFAVYILSKEGARS